ncbi:hypothetical protein HELRODRAFT_189487 [Helobdella robusta]|uniref:Protein zwilch n=1 Tax=Helobdella robusta TaxID=6412 RepID=T1FR33_HELRO|nr:hypothetical protein HELRODRAFT_189487 [Helobdella robusta]ESN94701.1 hypothetical protein HELRODRAFT_189487 [Helobdella robusta]
MAVSDKQNLFLKAFLRCVNSKTSSTYQSYALDYVDKSASPLPIEFWYLIKENEFVVVSKTLNKQAKNASDYVDLMIAGSVDNNAADNFILESEQTLGSPLELYDYQKDLHLRQANLNIEDNDEDKNLASKKVYLPLSLKEASTILSMYNITMQNYMKDIHTTINNNNGSPTNNHSCNNLKRLLVLCDGLDRNGIVCMSSLVSNNDFKNDNYNTNNNNIRDQQLVRVAVDSFVIKSKCYSFNMQEVPSVEQLLLGRLLTDCKRRQYTSTCLLYGSDKVEGHFNQVSVKFEWDDEEGSNALESPPIQATATLSIRIGDDMDGDAGGGDDDDDGDDVMMSNLSDDISSLQRLLRALEEEEVMWPVRNRDATARELVEKLIAEGSNSYSSQQQQPQQPPTSSDNNSNIETQQQHQQKSCKSFSLLKRFNMDFTDQLWDVMRDCSSYSELLSCFQCIFHALLSKQLQPMLSNTNRCTLADLIRQSYNGDVRRDVILWSKEEKPIILLAEMGLEKLKRDLLSAFIGSNMVNISQLAWYLCELETVGLNEKLEKLKRLAHVLRMNVLMGKKSLVPKAALFEILNKSLKHYEEVGDLVNPFQMQMSVLSIYDKIKKLSPTSWSCFVYGTTSFQQEIVGCVSFSKRQSFDHVKSDEILDSDDKSDKRSYYLTTVHQSINNY